MLSKEYKFHDIQRLYKFQEKKSSIIHAANTSKIPIPLEKKSRLNKTVARYWTPQQLPEIGDKYGFLSKPKKQHSICIYTPKGGVLKTSFTHNFARILALHNIKTLMIGLDMQCSLTTLTLGNPYEGVEDLEKLQQPLGIADIIKKNVNPINVIQHTDLPTLDIIPETPDLALLSKAMILDLKSERTFRKDLIEKINTACSTQGIRPYDVILFDNGPNWSKLTEASLYCSNVIVSPIGCDVGSYQSLQINLETIDIFKNTLELKWDVFYLIPTLLDRNRISTQILNYYRKNDPDGQISPYHIRKTAIGQEAAIQSLSVFELNPSSALADDYFSVITDLWNEKINATVGHA